jgi:hypothetical protein
MALQGKGGVMKSLNVVMPHGETIQKLVPLTVMRLLIIVLFVLSGCNNWNRVGGSTSGTAAEANSTATSLYTVSCCPELETFFNPDIGGNDLRTKMPREFRSSIPQSHIDFCSTVEAASRAGQLIDGKQYLAMHVGCGHGKHAVGDEYYPSTGY